MAQPNDPIDLQDADPAGGDVPPRRRARVGAAAAGQQQAGAAEEQQQGGGAGDDGAGGGGGGPAPALDNLLRLLAGGRGVVMMERPRAVAAGNDELVLSLKRSGMLSSDAVAKAMLTVPRGAFVPPEHAAEAYVDAPIRVERRDFNISAPHMHAQMLESLAISPGDRVADVGCGCGYLAAAAALLAGPTGEVVGLDTKACAVEMSAAGVARLAAGSREYAARACAPRFLRADAFIPSAALRGRFNKVVVGAAVPEERLHLLLWLLAPREGAALLAPVDSDLRLYTRQGDGRLKQRLVSSVRFSELEVPSDAAIALAVLRAEREALLDVRVSPPTLAQDVPTVAAAAAAAGTAMAMGGSSSGGGGGCAERGCGTPGRGGGRAGSGAGCVTALWSSCFAPLHNHHNQLSSSPPVAAGAGFLSGVASGPPAPVATAAAERSGSGAALLCPETPTISNHKAGCMGSCRGACGGAGPSAAAGAGAGPSSSAAAAAAAAAAFARSSSASARSSSMMSRDDDDGAASGSGRAPSSSGGGGGGGDLPMADSRGSPTSRCDDGRFADDDDDDEEDDDEDDDDDDDDDDTSSWEVPADVLGVRLGLGAPDCELVGHGAAWALRAHRAVLKSRSAHFGARLSSGMRDAHDARHAVPESFGRAAVAALLHYLYHDELPGGLGPPAVVRLLRAACYYGAPRLIELCERRLVAELLALPAPAAAAEAPHLLLLADELGLLQLRRAAVGFIAARYDEVVACGGGGGRGRSGAADDAAAAAACGSHHSKGTTTNGGGGSDGGKGEGGGGSSAWHALDRHQVELVAAQLASELRRVQALLAELEPPAGMASVPKRRGWW